MTDHTMKQIDALMAAAFSSPPKPKRDLSKPTLYDVDSNGEMQIINRNFQAGWVDYDDYMTMFNEYEDLQARLREIEELLQSGQPAGAAKSISEVVTEILSLCADGRAA